MRTQCTCTFYLVNLLKTCEKRDKNNLAFTLMTLFYYMYMYYMIAWLWEKEQNEGFC